MKRVLLLNFTLILSIFAMGQRVSDLASQKAHNKPFSASETEIMQQKKGIETSLPVAGSLDSIWYEDFSGGLPSGWVVAGANPIFWVSTDMNGPSATGYSDNFNAINSTTRTNGYLLFNADSMNFLTGPPGTGNPLEGSITSTMFDLSAFSDVKLNFQQFFRYCCANSAPINLLVSVSTDSIAWTDFDLEAGIGANNTPSDPDIKSINITTIAGGQSQVWIKFSWSGDASHYFWMIDDIALIEAPDNDIVMEEDFIDFKYLDYGNYTRTPYSQRDSILFRAAILNDGALAQSNVTMNVDVVNVGNAQSVYSQSSMENMIGGQLTTFGKLQRDTVVVYDPMFMFPEDIATYEVRIDVTQDEVDELPTNASTIRQFFSITDSVYARDNGQPIAGVAVGPHNYVDNDQNSVNVDGAVLANWFEIYKPAELNSISVHVSGSTAVGVTMVAQIWEVTDFSIPLGTTQIIASDLYDIKASDRNTWVTMPFQKDGVTEIIQGDPAGAVYLAGVELFNLNDTDPNEFHCSRDVDTKQPFLSSWLYVATTGSWSTIGRLPMIRLNIAPGYVGVKEVKSGEVIKLYQNYPNPFSEVTVLNYDLGDKAKVSLSVNDMAGRNILVIDEGTKVAGKHSIEINASDLPAGMYNYILTAGDHQIYNNMIVVE